MNEESHVPLSWLGMWTGLAAASAVLACGDEQSFTPASAAHEPDLAQAAASVADHPPTPPVAVRSEPTATQGVTAAHLDREVAMTLSNLPHRTIMREAPGNGGVEGQAPPSFELDTPTKGPAASMNGRALPTFELDATLDEHRIGVGHPN